MTRICEKFIEEITSGSGAVSEELTQHITSCSSCREAFESVRQLKVVRKPLTGKEAAAIAGILKAVKTGAATSTAAASSQAANSTSALLKVLLAAICAMSIIAAMFIYGHTPDSKTDNPISKTESVAVPKVETATTVSVDETANLTDTAIDAGAALNIDDQQTADPAVASASLDNTALEGNKTGEAQTIFVSPDQENIELR